MRNKISSLLILISLLVFSILVFSYSEEIIDQVSFSIALWKDKLLPTLFPFFLISELLIHYGFIEFIGGLTGKIFNKLFYISGEASFAIIASMVSGFPSGSKYARDLYDNKFINDSDATFLLTFTHFANPMFVIGMVGTFVLGNVELGYMILFFHMLGNVIIAFVFRRKKVVEYASLNIKDVLNKVHKKRMETESFINILIKSIYKSFKLLVLILGIITFFSMITIIISSIIPLSELSSTIICGILEMTQGINAISYIDIPIDIKASIITAFISFGGISVHFQVKSIIDGSNIKYKHFLIARILHSIISSLLVFIFV